MISEVRKSKIQKAKPIKWKNDKFDYIKLINQK